MQALQGSRVSAPGMSARQEKSKAAGKLQMARRKRATILEASVRPIVILILLLFLSICTRTTALRPDTAPRLSARDLSSIKDATTLEQITKIVDAGQYVDFRRTDSLLSKILIPRVPQSSENAKVREAILGPFRAAESKWKIEEHKFVTSTPEGDKHMTNLIVTYNHEAPHKLVLAAHHDSKVTPRGFIGATDSAVPCAIIVDTGIAIAKLLEESGSDKARDTALQLVFFDGEEAYLDWTDTDSIYGSRALAEKWTKDYFTARTYSKSDGNNQHEKRRVTPGLSTMRTIDSIDHLVLLDLLGAAHPRIPMYFADTQWMGQEMAEIEKRLAGAGLLFPKKKGSMSEYDFPPPASYSRTDLLPSPPGASSTTPKQYSFFAPRQVNFGGIGDDHIPFLMNGVPILHLIVSPFPPVWHTMKDDVTALDWPTTYAWTMLMRVFVAEYVGLLPDSARLKELSRQQSHKERDHSELVSRNALGTGTTVCPRISH